MFVSRDPPRQIVKQKRCLSVKQNKLVRSKMQLEWKHATKLRQLVQVYDYKFVVSEALPKQVFELLIENGQGRKDWIIDSDLVAVNTRNELVIDLVTAIG